MGEGRGLKVQIHVKAGSGGGGGGGVGKGTEEKKHFSLYTLALGPSVVTDKHIPNI